MLEDDDILLETTRLKMVLLLLPLRILWNGNLRIICIIVGEPRVSYVRGDDL